MRRFTAAVILFLMMVVPARGEDEAVRALDECRAAASQKNRKLALSTAGRATELWTAAAEAAPLDPTPHIRLAQIDMECRIELAEFMEKGRLMGSIEGHLGRALEIDPASFDAHLHLGILFYNVPPFLNRTGDAIRHLEKTLEIDRARSLLPYTLLGNLYERTGAAEKAAAIREEAAKRFPPKEPEKGGEPEAPPTTPEPGRGGANEMDTLGRAEVQKLGVPGLSIAVVRDGEPLMVRGFGLADVENGVPATPLTVYRLGSLSKQFLAAAILRLQERDVLDVHDPVTRWLGEARPAKPAITIHDLLTHTAGLPLQPVIDDQGRWIAPTLAAAGTPGARSRYSNAGYALAGEILERAAKRPFFEVLRDEVFRPAGMEQTGDCDERRIIPHRAEGYGWMGDRLVNDEPLESSPSTRYAGGVCSSAADLVRWFAWLVRQPLFAAMTARHTHGDRSSAPYGYGFRLGKEDAPVQHSGAVNGFLSRIEYHPQERLLIAVLFNSEAADPARFAETIRWTVLQPHSR